MTGGDFNLNLSPEEYPNLITFPMFEPAGKLVGIERSGKLEFSRIVMFHLGKKSKEAQNVTARELHNHTAFSLTLAKIAYTYAVAERGLDGFDGDEIRALLRCERDDVYNFVGGLSTPGQFANRHLHALYIMERSDILTVVVHLFASCKMLPYEVVVGKLK